MSPLNHTPYICCTSVKFFAGLRKRPGWLVAYKGEGGIYLEVGFGYTEADL